MKTRALFATGVVFLLSILGCREDEGRKHIVNYLNNDILRIYQFEETALKHYGSATGKNYTNEKVLYETLKKLIIPTYSEFVNLLEKIRPPNVDLREIHGIYIQSAHAFQTGFDTLLSALEKNDPALTQRANRYIFEGKQKGEEWRKALLALCQKHGIKVEKKDPDRKKLDPGQ